jgi:hypothetical protein
MFETTPHEDIEIDRRYTIDVGKLLTRGAVAGLVAGLAFILANMWFAYAHDKPAVAPLIDISTIFNAADKPTLTPNAVPVEIGTGIMLHLAFSAAFGMGFALLVPLLRNVGWLVAGALGYGLALYLLNFQILGHTVFPWFTDPNGPHQIFELLIHPLIYGLFLVPFFLPPIRLGSRSRF